MRTISILSIATLLFMALAGSSHAGALGNPLSMVGSRHFFVSAEYDWVSRIIDETGNTGGSGTEYQMKSGRYLAKAGIGLLNFLDLYFRLGASDLKVGQFEGDIRFSYGGGAKLNLFHLKAIKTRGYVIGQMLHYTSEGTVSEMESQYVELQFQDEYTWREYQWAAIVGTQVKSAMPYLGLEKTSIVGEVKRHHQVIEGVATTIPGYESSGGDFADDQQSIRPVFGMDLRLPGQYMLSLEVRGVTKDEFSFTVGMSQSAPIGRQTKKSLR